MKVSTIILALVCIFTFNQCDKESPAPTRSFYMGFTPFPYAISLEAVDFTYQKIAESSDIICHHFDNGVPWVEALSNQPFHANIQNDWTFRKSKTPTSLKVYVSVGALSIERTGLAKYRGESDDMPLPSPWNTYRFNDQNVKTAYVNYCKRIIEFFNPEFFNMSIEANLLHYVNPSLWSDYLEFHQHVFTELKVAYPNLTIFSSVTGAHLLENFFGGNDHMLQRQAAAQILEFSDLYALSFYPYLSSYVGNPYPENMFEELFSISDKPLAIAETGYPAQSFTIHTNGIDVLISSDPQKQSIYLEDLLEACERRKAKFVINFIIRDYDELWESIGGNNDLSIAWRDTGMYDENGEPREALSTWKKYLERKFSF